MVSQHTEPLYEAGYEVFDLICDRGGLLLCQEVSSGSGEPEGVDLDALLIVWVPIHNPLQGYCECWQDILACFLHDFAEYIAARFRFLFVVGEEGTEASVGIAEDNRHIEDIHLLFWINENPIFREHVCL